MLRFARVKCEQKLSSYEILTLKCRRTTLRLFILLWEMAVYAWLLEITKPPRDWLILRT